MKTFTKRYLPGEISDHRGKLNLRITGFHQQSIVTVEEIVSAIDRLPSFHLEGLREIRFAPEDLIYHSSDYYEAHLPGPRKAEFRQPERRILIYDFDSKSMFYQLLYHEIGHFVYFLAINSVVKKQWVTKVHPGLPSTTPYGSRNFAEDFAESYACFVRDQEDLRRRLPEKWQFMRDKVFSGKPETRKEKNNWMV